MSYIDKHTLKDENIIYQTRRHWVIFSTPLIITILAMVFLSLNSLLVLVGWICLLAAVVSWISSIVTYVCSEYGVTNKRVLIKLGFIRRQSFETILSRIAGIQVDQSIFGRLLGFGSIIIQSTGGEHGRYHGIDDPMLFRRQVQEQIEASLQETGH